VRKISLLGEDGEKLGRFTVSMGVSAFPDHGDTPATLMAAADLALFDAKHGGRDRVCVAQPIDEPDAASSP